MSIYFIFRKINLGLLFYFKNQRIKWSYLKLAETFNFNIKPIRIFLSNNIFIFAPVKTPKYATRIRKTNC
jgi:hypothetical protein